MMAKVVLIDTRWLNLEKVTALYHPECVARIVAFHHMKPAESSARYQVYRGTMQISTKCDFCRKPVLIIP